MAENVKPARLQLSRRRGFNLQALSLTTNGLEAVRVCRPSKWGNPFPVSEWGRDIAIAKYRKELARLIDFGALDPNELRGKNLACFCKLDEACHADVLLEIANGFATINAADAEVVGYQFTPLGRFAK